MPEPEKIKIVVDEWVVRAEHDLTTALHILKIRRDCPTDAVCFHAQQCVEKYLKALLVYHQVAFPKTHDIEKILSLMPAAVAVALPKSEADALTQYATMGRYPGWRTISLAEARQAAKIARRVRREVRKLLPVNKRIANRG